MPESFDINNVPEDAPKELKILSKNMAAILNNIEALRGTEYVTLACALMTADENVKEFERFACDKIPSTDRQHTLIHIYAAAIGEGLARIAFILNSNPAFKDIIKDLDTLSGRVKEDWHSKKMY